MIPTIPKGGYEKNQRVRRVEYDPGYGWIARDKFGVEYMDDFRWASRSIARAVVEADRAFGDIDAEARRAGKGSTP